MSETDHTQPQQPLDSMHTTHEQLPVSDMNDIAQPAVADVPQPKEPIWPQAPAHHGGIYSFPCAVHGNRMIAMTLETFLDLRGTLERMRGALTDAQAANIKLFQETQELQKRLSEQASRQVPGVAVPEKKIITPRGGM